MEEKTTKESARKKAELLLHHLKPAASAFALGIGASLAATLLRTLFTQIIRFTVDHALMGDRAGLPGFLMDTTAGQLLVWCAAAAAVVALLEFAAGFVQDSNLPKAPSDLSNPCAMRCMGTSRGCRTAGMCRMRQAISFSGAPPTWRSCARLSPSRWLNCSARRS